MSATVTLPPRPRHITVVEGNVHGELAQPTLQGCWMPAITAMGGIQSHHSSEKSAVWDIHGSFASERELVLSPGRYCLQSHQQNPRRLCGQKLAYTPSSKTHRHSTSTQAKELIPAYNQFSKAAIVVTSCWTFSVLAYMGQVPWHPETMQFWQQSNSQVIHYEIMNS